MKLAYIKLAAVLFALQPLASSHAQQWIATWGASQQIPEPQNALPADAFHDATLRQVFHLSAGGSMLRIHVSNAFGSTALHVTSLHLAKPISNSSPAIMPGTDKALTVNGSTDFFIPPGAEIASDPVELRVAPLSDLCVSLHVDTPPEPQTGHPGSRATTWFAHGDQTSAATLDIAQKIDHWYQITGIDVLTPSKGGTVVALGDSITDGHGATTNGNDRWTDVLARRLHASPATGNIGVSNQGIGGNHLLTDGLGPNALARFDRDVLAPAGVRWVIVLEGVNDLGGLERTAAATPAEHDALVGRILSAYQQMIDRAHAHGLKVYGATITPYVGSDYYHPGPRSESDRKAVNAWIRAKGHFDAVIDFDQVTRDPSNPERLAPQYDSGDHLHPSPAGYRAMGEAIPLNLFR